MSYYRLVEKGKFHKHNGLALTNCGINFIGLIGTGELQHKRIPLDKEICKRRECRKK